MEDFPSNPYAPPEAPLELEQEDRGGLRPVPFEDCDAIPGFWRRVGGMFVLLFQRPFELVDRVPVTESLAAPLRFVLLLSLPATALGTLMGILMGVMGAFSTGTTKGEPPPAFFMGIGAVYIFIMPLAAFGGFFILGLLQHGLLWLWGGLRQGRGLRQTLRLHGYYLAFFLLFYMVPLLNFLILLGGPALFGIVAARVHRTDRWRAICAAYTPLLLCCGTYIAIFAIAIAMGGFK